MTKSEDLRRINSQIRNGSRKSKHWKEIFEIFYKAQREKDITRVVCPQCPRSSICHDLNMFKNHVEKHHFDLICHTSMFIEGINKLKQLNQDAKEEEIENIRRENERENVFIEQSSFIGNEASLPRNFEMNTNCDYSSDDSCDSDDDLFSEMEDEYDLEDDMDVDVNEIEDSEMSDSSIGSCDDSDESDDEVTPEKMVTQKKKRRTDVHKVIGDNFFERIMEMFDIVEKISQKRQNKLGDYLIDLLNEYDKLSPEKKTIEVKNLYRKVASSDHLRKRYQKIEAELDGKAVQKLEIFLKFEAIFDFLVVDGIQYSFEELLVGSGGLELYLAAKHFTILAFARELYQDDLNKMKLLSATILRKYTEITKCEVYCKLHHLQHYHQLVEIYGPLRHFANFVYEAKHQFSKAKARLMYNFRNALKSIAEEHQLKRALLEKKMDFKNKDFYELSSLNCYMYEKIPDNMDKLTSPTDFKPFSLKKNIILGI